MRRWYHANSQRVKEQLAARRKARPEMYAAQRRRFQRAGRAFVDALKSVPCADCSGVFDPVCMDFDHRPGEVKRYAVAKMVGKFTPDAIRAEVAKCDVVCANCHRLRTKRRTKGAL